jgi:hypothetical protein
LSIESFLNQIFFDPFPPNSVALSPYWRLKMKLQRELIVHERGGYKGM